MPFLEFLTMVFTAIIFDVFLLLIGITMGKWYFITLVFALFVNVLTSVNDNIRAKTLGFIPLKLKDFRVMDIINVFSSILPIFNVVYSVMRYHYSVCVSDNEFKKRYPGKLLKPREAINKYKVNTEKEPLIYIPHVKKGECVKLEYQNVSNKQYEFSCAMESVDTYLDYILLNKNLTNKQKEKVLKQLKKSIILTNQVNLSKKQIKKLQKCK